MDKFLFGCGVFCVIFFGILWLLWGLYCYVAEAFWPGHGALSDPGYWQFVAGWVLLGLVAKMFKGGNKK